MSPQPVPTLVHVARIWDAAPHSGFTDLIRYKNQWVCAFRESSGHMDRDGTLRVITSPDGRHWTSAALIDMPGVDLRDPKLSITPDGRLMMLGMAGRPKTKVHHRSMTWFSDDAAHWDNGTEIGDENFWLWRATWHKNIAYIIGYGNSLTRLYTTRDGKTLDTLVPTLFGQGYSNEHSLLFQHDDTVICLLRRDFTKDSDGSAQLGMSRPPYTDWQWRDLGVRIGGPQMLRLPDGRIVAAVRLYEQERKWQPARTSLCWLDIDAGTLTEFMRLPSEGDSSYAGMVHHDGLLGISYYSSHEGKTSIYLAKVKF